MKITDLKEPYLSMAVIEYNNYIGVSGDRYEYSPNVFDFDWESTKQGYDFWNSVDDNNNPYVEKHWLPRSILKEESSSPSPNTILLLLC
jgi:hypothetical protein